MADSVGIEDIVEEYRRFTYPYGIRGRLEDITAQVKKRKIDGLYTTLRHFALEVLKTL